MRAQVRLVASEPLDPAAQMVPLAPLALALALGTADAGIAHETGAYRVRQGRSADRLTEVGQTRTWA